jgi:hypothetical protein
MGFVDPYFRQQLITHCQPVCLSRLCLLKVYWKFLGRSALCSSRLLGALRVPIPLCCMFLFSSLFIIQFCVGVGRDHSVQGAMLVYPRGGCGNTTGRLFAHLLVCVSQAGWEPTSGGVGALLISHCNMYRLRVQGFGVLLLLGGFFLRIVAPVCQQNFWFTKCTLSASSL